jgi:hypothetical protein
VGCRHGLRSRQQLGFDHGRNVALTCFCTAKSGLSCGTPAIAGEGVPSSTAAAGFIVSAGPARSCKPGLLLYNAAQMPALPFQGGTLCIETTGLRRAGSTNSKGTPGPASCDGFFRIDMNTFASGAWLVPDCDGAPASIPPNAPAGLLTVPGTVVFGTFWGRDSAATGSFVSDGLRWTIGA